MHRLLIVEDSLEYQKVITRSLGSYRLLCVPSAEEAWTALGREPFDLVILDIGLPEKDGHSLLADIQGSADLRSIPVICLTGKTGITDKVTAFSLGADDYMQKPFDPLELRARVDAKLAKRAREREEADRFQVAELTIDRRTHRVSVKDEKKGERDVHLTQTEFKLLYRLASRPERVFTRDQLLVSAWGEDAEVLDRAVDVHLCSLRKKLGVVGTRIEAIPGVGYRFTLGKVSAQKKKAA